MCVYNKCQDESEILPKGLDTTLLPYSKQQNNYASLAQD